MSVNAAGSNDPRSSTINVLSIPRDLQVDIPGQGTAKVNSAYSLGGPSLLIRTIRQNVFPGLKVNHIIDINFGGFDALVNSIGCVYTDVDHRYYNNTAVTDYSSINLQPGYQKLCGPQALSFVRFRHTDSDIVRSARQQDFIRRVLKKALAVRNPLTLNSLLGSAVHNLTIDNKFSQGDMLRLGKRFRSLSPDAVDMLTLPGDPVQIGGASVLKLHEPAADETIKRFLLPPPLPPPGPPSSILPNSVRIRVLNGSGTAGEATSVAKQLQEGGFGVAGTGDADSFRYITPVIRYGTGQRDKAALLQSAMVGGAELREDPTLRGVDLVLITGSGLKGIRLGAQAPAAAPTTTAPPAGGPAPTPGGAPANRGAPSQPQCGRLDRATAVGGLVG